MHFWKHRPLPCILISGILASICLISGSFLPVPLTGSAGQAYAASLPDLSIQSITVTPAQPSIGDRVYFNVVVANDGSALADNSRLAFYVDNDLIDTASISQVDINKTVSYSFAWRGVTGAHIARAAADSDSGIAESNENNNERSCAFSVLAPDLIIENLAWTPEKPSAGDLVTYTLTLKNTGDRTSGAFMVDFVIDGASRGQQEMPALEPGRTSNTEYTWATIPGQHRLEAGVDVLNQVFESNESNNSLTTYYCTTPPDLVIYSLIPSPQNRTDADTVTMSVTVKNQGEGDSSGSYLSYYVDDTLKKSVYLNGLAAGANVTVTYAWVPGADAHTFKAVTDPDNLIFESDESNNARSLTLPPLGLPDVSIKSVVWSPEKPTPHSRVTFTVTIANNGLRTVNTCDVALYITGGIKISRQPGPIPAGSSIQTTMQYMTTDAPVNLRAVVDEGNFIAESDETNNEIAFSLTPELPEPVADLVVESVSWLPESPADGDLVTLNILVKNQGPGASGPSCVSCYIDNVSIGDIYFGALNAAASIQTSTQWKAVSGNHKVKLVIDSYNLVFETKEDNNEAVFSLLTSDPDLAVENIQWFPTYPEIGNQISFTVTVKNQGNRASKACFLTYYIDDVKQGEHYLDAIEPGAIVSRIFNTDMQTASHVFRVVIDDLNTVRESNETNNSQSVVIPAPDLTVKSITSSDDYPMAGAVMSFTIDITNTGRSAAGATSTAGYLDGNPLALVTTETLNPGDSSQSLFFWTAQPGKHTLRIIADADNAIAESDETNNIKEVIIFVPMPITTVVTEPSSDNETFPVTTETTPLPLPTTPVVTSPTSTTIPFIEDAFKDLETLNNTGNTTPDISANISSTEIPKSGIASVLTNKWLLIGVAVVGVATICILLLLRKQSGKLKKEKEPKLPKPPKAPKQAKQQPPVKAAPAKTVPVKPGPITPGTTLSGKPAVLVPPPPKPGSAPATIKVIVPPDARKEMASPPLRPAAPPPTAGGAKPPAAPKP